MKTIIRACVPVALSALVIVAFTLTVRVCDAPDARAGEPDLIVTHGLPIHGGPDWVEVDRVETGPGVPAEQTARLREDPPDHTPGSPRLVPSVDDGSEQEAAGNVRLHNMAAWDSPDRPMVFVSFTPISETFLTGDVPFRHEVVGGEDVEVADVAPDLDASDLRAEIDGRPAEISSLNWYYAGYGDLAGADTKYMPVCLITVASSTLTAGRHEVHVMIYDAETGVIGESVATFECGVAEL